MSFCTNVNKYIISITYTIFFYFQNLAEIIEEELEAEAKDPCNGRTCTMNEQCCNGHVCVDTDDSNFLLNIPPILHSLLSDIDY